jgi:hypothetical protein
MADPDIDAMEGDACDEAGVSSAATAALLRSTLEDFGDGDTSVKDSADLVIVLANDSCRAYAWRHGNVLMPAMGEFHGPFLGDGRVLVHELGHAIGGLRDEYGPSLGAGEGGCEGLDPNVTTHRDTPAWRCLTHMEGAPRCPASVAGVWSITFPGGEEVGTYSGVGLCPNLFKPCPDCMMNAYASFCPVCRAQLEVEVNRRLFVPLEEECNGVDDNRDGEVDEGCACGGEMIAEIPVMEEPTGPPPGAGNCSEQTRCASCTREYPCGWSASQGRCLRGNELASDDGTSGGSDWRFDPGAC